MSASRLLLALLLFCDLSACRRDNPSAPRDPDGARAEHGQKDAPPPPGPLIAFEPPLVRAEAIMLDYVDRGSPRDLEQAEARLRKVIPPGKRHDYPRFLLAFTLSRLGRTAEAEAVLAETDPDRRHVYERFFAGSPQALAPYLRTSVRRACQARSDLDPQICRGADTAEPADFLVYEQISSLPHSTDRFYSWNIERSGESVADLARRIGLRPGMDIADVGAGEGWFTIPFARVVGSEGSVVANDIAPDLLEFINFGARFHRLDNVKTLIGTPSDPGLPAESFDMVFICEVFKAIYNNRDARDRALVEARVLPFVKALHRSLRPGGKLVLIEHDRPRTSEKDISPEVLQGHVEEAGFRLESTLDAYRPLQATMIFVKEPAR